MTGQVKCAAVAMGAALLLAAPLTAQGDEDERYGYVGTALFGDQEVGSEGAGDNASADFMAEFDYKDGKICYMLELDGVKNFTAAHIHKAKIGENGPPVITLKLSEDGDDVCEEADAELMKDIASNEADYYVNVHTKRYPAGAVRGQLGAE